MPVYSIDLNVAATLYVKADDLDKAKALAAGFLDPNNPVELVAVEHSDPPSDDPTDAYICGKNFDDPALPILSISPAMTILGSRYDGDRLGKVLEGPLLDWEEYDEGKVNDAREAAANPFARIAAQEANIGEQGRLVRDLTKRARDAEEQRDQNRDTAIEFETALAAMTKERDEALHFLDVAVDKSPEPLKKLGKHLASLLDEDDWPTAERLLNGAATALAAERAKTAKLVEALEAAEAWIVDGGYLDDKDPCTAESAASVYEQTRAAITEAGQ